VKIAVFVSGRGSNLEAILNSAALKNSVKVEAVISDKTDCPAFKTAAKFSIPVFTVGDKNGAISFELLLEKFASLNIELIVLAGFLKLIPSAFIKKFGGKIINIHPALLPSFGGKGMYGLNVHKAVFNSSAKVSGATVHYVDETFDTGLIISQKCVDIHEASSPEEIAEKVLRIEHELLPYVIQKIAEGKVKNENNRIIILN
jgi:phosphoribosylglycinamide formyltransferase 1